MNASDYLLRKRCCGYTPSACPCPTTIDVSCTAIIDPSSVPIIVNAFIDPSSAPIDVSCTAIIDPSSVPIIVNAFIDPSSAPIIVNAFIDPSSAPIDVSCTAIIDPSSVPIVVDLSGLTHFTNSDAFARLRVSNPYTLFEYNSIGGINPYLMQDSSSGTGTLTANTNDTFLSLAVSGGPGEVIYQSREYIMYQAGKSKLVMMTGVLYMDVSATAGVTTRIGCFDVSMGIYLQMQDGAISAVIDNTLVQTTPRSAWNRDPLDGTGPSGINVDFTKAQIFWWDYEWLGVGQVRAGIVVNGVFVTYHIFEHFNLLTFPYIQMAKLPLRYQIISTGSSVNSMRAICGTVISEGGVSPLGKTFTYGNFTTGAVTVNTNNPLFCVPIMGIRLKTTNPANRATLKLKNIDIFSTTTAAAVSWQLLLNPIITGVIPTWIDYSTIGGPRAAQSAVQYIQYNTITTPNATNVVGGLILYSGFIGQRVTGTIIQTTDELIGAYAAGTNIAGTVADEIILVANNLTNVGSVPSIIALLQWIELL